MVLPYPSSKRAYQHSLMQSLLHISILRSIARYRCIYPRAPSIRQPPSSVVSRNMDSMASVVRLRLGCEVKTHILRRCLYPTSRIRISRQRARVAQPHHPPSRLRGIGMRSQTWQVVGHLDGPDTTRWSSWSDAIRFNRPQSHIPLHQQSR